MEESPNIDEGWYNLFHDPLNDISKFCCPHTQTTEHDENGDAICLKCGTVVEIRFNIDRFRERIRNLFKT